jgi:putative hydrolase of the HAD superfamily
VNAITFDLIGVLTTIPRPETIHFEKERREYSIYETIIRQYDISRAQFDHALKTTYSTIIFERETRCFDYGVSRLTNLLLTNLSLVPEYSIRVSIEQSFINSIFDLQLEPRKEALAVLKEIKREGYKLGLIVNTLFSSGDALREIVVNNLGMGFLFDSMAFSNEVGFLKPHNLIFDTAQRLLGIDNPKEILHVGDNPSTDIKGANEAKFRSAFFQNRRHSKKEDIQADYEISYLNELPGLIKEIDW